MSRRRFAKPKRERTIYREVYRSPGLRITDDRRPTTGHQASGFVVDEAFILAAGCVEVDGRQREYHDVRIYYTGASTTTELTTEPGDAIKQEP